MRQRVIGKSLFSQVVDSDQYSGIYSPDTQYYFKSKETWPAIEIFSSMTLKSSISGKDGPTTISQFSSVSTGMVTSQFSLSGGILTWTVPITGTYTITAYGAQGGTSSTYSGGGVSGRPGAKIQGNFTLISGTQIKILIGQTPDPTKYDPEDQPGGGGTYVVQSPYTNDSDILVIAGGGGGASNNTYGSGTGVNGAGQAGNNGGTADGGSASAATNGDGGGSSNQTVQGGAGYTGNSLTPPPGSLITDALSFKNGGTGGTGRYTPSAISNGEGGFGGGGYSGRGGTFGPSGGGGGYSGGAAGYNSSYGGGGGSYNNGTSQTNTTGGATAGGNGYVTIELV